MLLNLLTKKPFIVITLFVASLISISAFYPSGSPGGYTNSPSDAKNCTLCHGGSATSVANFISTNIPAEGYTAEQTYDITVSYTGSGHKGFELTCEDTLNTKTGQFIISSGTKLVNNNNAITHDDDINSTTATWNFTWTAPAQGTGTVTFYSALVAQEEHTKLCSLQIYEKNTSGIEQLNTSFVNIFPNPAKDILNIVTENIDNKELSIYNIKGQLCKSVNIQRNARIDISNLAEGLYYLKLNDKGKTSNLRFIKNN